MEDKGQSHNPEHANHSPARTGRGPLMRLTFIAAVLALLSASLSAFMPWNVPINGKAVQIALSSFLLSVYCGVYWYAWTRFKGARELRWFLIAAAFSLLFLVEVADTAAAAGARISWMIRIQNHYGYAPILAAGIMLAFAGSTERLVRRPDLRSGLDRMLAWTGVMVLGYFTCLHMYAFGKRVWRAIISTSLYTSGTLYEITHYGLLIFVAGLYGTAVFLNAKRACRKKEHQAWFLAHWCVLMGLSTIYSGISCNEYDSNWWISTVVSAIAGVVLLVGLNSENGRTHVEVQEKISELEILHALSWKLVGTGTLDSLSQAFAWALAENLRADIAAVFLKEPGSNGLRLHAVAGTLHQPLQGIGNVHSLEPARRPGFHNGHTASAFQDLKPVVVDDIYADVEFLPWPILAQHKGKVISIPIVSSGEALGVYDLYITSKETVSPEQIRLFETIAAAAGAAIQHVQIRQSADSYTELDDAA